MSTYSKTKLYYVWRSMKQRCNNPNDPKYHNYGARGIRVCEDWENSFTLFSNWAYANGYEEGLFLDRIDNNKGYYPGNLRWVPEIVSALNRRDTTKKIRAFGEEKSLSEWARDPRCTVSYNGLRARYIRDRMSIEEALTKPNTRQISGYGTIQKLGKGT